MKQNENNRQWGTYKTRDGDYIVFDFVPDENGEVTLGTSVERLRTKDRTEANKYIQEHYGRK